MPLVSSEQSFVIALIVAASVAAAIASERTRIGKALSATIVVMVFGIALSNISVIPREATLYGHIFTYLVPVALPLFLFEAQWSRIVVESGRLLYSFVAGAVGVVSGAVIAIQFVDLGAYEAAWAGTFSASYIGGTINFVSVSTSLELPLDDVAIALSTDTVIGTVLLIVLVLASSVSFVSRALPGQANEIEAESIDRINNGSVGSEDLPFSQKVTSQVLGLVVSVAIVLAAIGLARLIKAPKYTILLVTLITLVFANVAPGIARRLRYSFFLGVVLMLSFFFVIGASADIATMIQSGEAFIVFLSILILVHLIFVFVASWFFRFHVSEAVIASCACALGPTVAAGVAANKEWKALVTPGIVCGVLGYSIANFIGVGLAGILN